MDLSTRWLGLSLPHPFIVGASPLVDDLDKVKQLEDAGAAAFVMHSLFEEQIEGAVADMDPRSGPGRSATASHAFYPAPEQFALGAHEYLEQVRRIHASTRVPVIASLNGTRAGPWLRYAALLESAGAAAVELNLHLIPTDPRKDGAAIERELLEVVLAVRGELRIPLAVKILPGFSSLPHFARELAAAGADGLVLFNRFHQPDFDVEAPDLVWRLPLSDPSELTLRLHWTALLSSQLPIPIAISGGVHDARDAVKALLAGAAAVQLVSVLLRRGPPALEAIRGGVAELCERHGYGSLSELRASLGLQACPDFAALLRGSYLRMLQIPRAALR